MHNSVLEKILLPPVAFLLFLLIFYLLYFLIGRVAPKVSNIGGKLKTYACGEDIPGQKIQFGYRLFFFIALFFTMMHVASLVIATVPKGPLVYFGVFYLAMIFLSVLALITRD